MTLAIAEPGARLREGRYELERLLGRGGAATVWLARDEVLGRRVAVKLLSEALADDADWLARFRREARIAAGLTHPNLVSVFDFGFEGERPYLVMAYLPGGSLADRLSAGGCPDPERLARDLLRALEHIHQAGIVHRDVKPANVLFDRDGRACLTDFGVARPEDATSITRTGQIPGTGRYMAPELWRGEPATPRSDLFACGVVLAACAEASAPARLVTLVERLRDPEPARRPASAAAALDLLDPSHAGSGERRPAPASEPRTSAPGGRRSAVLGLLAVVAAVAVAIGVSVAGDDGSGGNGGAPASEERAAGAAGQGAGGDSESEAAAAGSAAAGTTASAPDPAAGVALNDRGFALIGEGRYEEAIPVLERAVAKLEGTGDIRYAYALYNLGHALRLAGRPEEAIPILEQRLEIPDQTETVQAELDRARAEAAAAD